MYALVYIGVLLEPKLGASGAIFGMHGVYLALLTTNLIEKTQRKALLTSIGIFVGYNLLYGTKGRVDNAAHMGGLISGMLIGYLFYPGLRKPDRPGLLYSAVVVAALLVVATCFIAFKKIPNDYGLYQRKLHSFARMEKKALAAFNVNRDPSQQIWPNVIRDSGIYYWNQCIQVLDEANELELSSQVKDRNDALIRYCNLRILSYNYYYKKIVGSGDPGEDSVSYYSAQITNLMDSLKNDK
jgi:rhomboid protease GluP